MSDDMPVDSSSATQETGPSDPELADLSGSVDGLPVPAHPLPSEHAAATPYLWMLCGAVSFAAMGAFTRGVSQQFDWQVIALVRTGLALLFAAMLAKAAGAKLVFFRPLTLWLRSLAGSISLICTFYALTRLPVADVLTLTNVFPIWVALLSWPLLKEAPGWDACLAIGLGLCGVVVVQQPALAEGNWASLIALASSFSTAVAMLGLHRLKGIDARAIVVHFSAVSMLACLVAMVVFPRDHLSPATMDLATWMMLLGVGASATLGQICLTKAFAAGPPAKVSVVGLTQVGFGMIFDILFWNRTFELMTLAGMALIVCPSAWLMTRKR